MAHQKYPTLHSEEEIRETLFEMGVDILEPETKREQVMADAMEAFSSFVFEQEPDKCLAILDNDSTDTVGELQGGTDSYRIYRVSIPDENDPHGKNDPAVLLLVEFHASSIGKKYVEVLTIPKLKEYMLGMCQKRSARRGGPPFVSLGNLMFVLQFGGPTTGQVRHIDNMVSNVQICLYMSPNCPSTVIYEMESNTIVDSKSLLEHWSLASNDAMPLLITVILQEWGSLSLRSKWYTRYFGFWGTIDSQLSCFGKLYEAVAFQHSISETDPGTTLIAGGNEVHAGPPTHCSRMFAFAIGIPEVREQSTGGEDEGNNGEVQYSPVTLHIDLCCIFFSILDEECGAEGVETITSAKEFLLNVLVVLVKDYPMKWYLQQIDPDRVGLLEWLERLLDRYENDLIVRELLKVAVESDDIFYTPDVISRRSGRKSSRRRK